MKLLGYRQAVSDHIEDIKYDVERGEGVISISTDDVYITAVSYTHLTLPTKA